MKVRKLFWIGIAAAAAFAMACGGNDSGPDARQELTGDLAQFGYWEVLVKDYHTASTIARRSVFRDVLVLEALDKGLYETYLRAWERGNELAQSEGASSDQLGEARAAFNNALRAVREASANPGTLDRSRLSVALRSAMEVDRETWGLSASGEVPNLGFWNTTPNPNNPPRPWVMNNRDIFDTTVSNSNADLMGSVVTGSNNVAVSTGSALSAPIANMIDAVWWFRPEYMFDQFWISSLHDWIEAGAQTFLNRFADPEIVLTQYAIDRQTASLEEGVAFIRDRRLSRNQAISIRFHVANSNPALDGEGALPPSNASQASATSVLAIPNFTAVVDNRPPASQQGSVRLQANTINITGDIEWLLVSHHDPLHAQVLSGSDFDERGWPVDGSISLESASNAGAVVAVNGTLSPMTGKIYVQARYVRPAPLAPILSPQILEIDLQPTRQLVATVTREAKWEGILLPPLENGRIQPSSRVVGAGDAPLGNGRPNTALATTDTIEVMIPPTLSIGAADPVMQTFNIMAYWLDVGRGVIPADTNTGAPASPAPTYTVQWVFTPADGTTNTAGIGVGAGATTPPIAAPGASSVITNGTPNVSDPFYPVHLIVGPGASPGRLTITVTYDDMGIPVGGPPAAPGPANLLIAHTLVLNVDIVAPGTSFTPPSGGLAGPVTLPAGATLVGTGAAAFYVPANLTDVLNFTAPANLPATGAWSTDAAAGVGTINANTGAFTWAATPTPASGTFTVTATWAPGDTTVVTVAYPSVAGPIGTTVGRLTAAPIGTAGELPVLTGAGAPTESGTSNLGTLGADVGATSGATSFNVTGTNAAAIAGVALNAGDVEVTWAAFPGPFVASGTAIIEIAHAATGASTFFTLTWNDLP